MTSSTQLTLSVRRSQPNGGWDCAVVSDDHIQTVALASDEAVAEFLAEQLERLVVEAARHVEQLSYHERCS